MQLCDNFLTLSRLLCHFAKSYYQYKVFRLRWVVTYHAFSKITDFVTMTWNLTWPESRSLVITDITRDVRTRTFWRPRSCPRPSVSADFCNGLFVSIDKASYDILVRFCQSILRSILSVVVVYRNKHQWLVEWHVRVRRN